VAAAEADLSELMDSAYALFASRFEACNIKLHREYEPGMMLFCRGDELRQVFANLLSNALDAMRHGGQLRIRIRTGHSWGRDESIGVRVVVCDSGTGIPPELRKKIFEPFISTKADTGTGLGLWVSEGIVKKHRGRISLYSHTGERQHGTVFSLFFPLDGINADQGGDLRGQAGDLP
jgi:two-component system CheB/CheR fusion protein